MTRYTVVWHPVAGDRLSEMWLVSTSREDITTASNLIDREMTVDALERGSIGPRFRRFVVTSFGSVLRSAGAGSTCSCYSPPTHRDLTTRYFTE
jgi:hypothetical protein